MLLEHFLGVLADAVPRERLERLDAHSGIVLELEQVPALDLPLARHLVLLVIVVDSAGEREIIGSGKTNSSGARTLNNGHRVTGSAHSCRHSEQKSPAAPSP